MNFDFKNFNWKEATSNENGQSSAALFIAFWFGISLIWLTLVVSILLIVNAIHKIEVDFTSTYLFIGTQFGVLMGYLGVRLSSNNNLKINTTNTDKQA
jgi:Na+/citrate or Na+/malate symporter